MDIHDILELERRMTDAVEQIQNRVDAVGMARQIKEFMPEMRKSLLAKYVAPLLLTADSATAAETLARFDPRYQQELEQLQEQMTRAERHIAQHDADYARYEAARSALSMARTQVAM